MCEVAAIDFEQARRNRPAAQIALPAQFASVPATTQPTAQLALGF
ncbi:hypothetical protein [Labrys neptuniae]